MYLKVSAVILSIFCSLTGLSAAIPIISSTAGLGADFSSISALAVPAVASIVNAAVDTTETTGWRGAVNQVIEGLSVSVGKATNGAKNV